MPKTKIKILKPEVVWQAKDKRGDSYRIVAIYFHSETDGKDNPWYLAEKMGEDAMGKKIWIPWTI